MILDIMRRWLSNPEQDTLIDMGVLQIQFNHRTKTAYLFVTDPATPDHAYDDLAAHLAKRGYLMVGPLIPSAPLPFNPGANQ